jgi:4-carboxymuconolactone decarboxylase
MGRGRFPGCDMKKLTQIGAAGLMAATPAAAQEAPREERKSVAPADMKAITPALARYTDDVLFGDNWENPRLSKRDRSLVTISALIAGGKSAQLAGHLGRALDNGVTPQEISGVLTHLAFYSGWPNAVSAIGVAQDIFAKRGIGSDQIPPATMPPMTLEPTQEKARAAMVNSTVAPSAPNLARFTNDTLFGDLWRRPDLSPRDRSLMTVAALTMAGDTGQTSYHLGRALDNGVTTEQLAETMTHLAFYAGWPKGMSGAALVREETARRASAPSPAAPDAALVIARHGEGPAQQGPAANFTGKVEVTGRFAALAPSRTSGATVTFQPGARTAWHSHPLGQTLIVTQGVGWTQIEGGPIVEMRAGDVIVAPPGARHWHGASPSSVMRHVAIAETADGKVVDWFEQVDDATYRSGPTGDQGGSRSE